MLGQSYLQREAINTEQSYCELIRSVQSFDISQLMNSLKIIQKKIHFVLSNWEDSQQLFHRECLPNLIKALRKKYTKLNEQNHTSNWRIKNALNVLRFLFEQYETICRVRLEEAIPELEQNGSQFTENDEFRIENQFLLGDPQSLPQSQAIYEGLFHHQKLMHQFLSVCLNETKDNVLDSPDNKKKLCAALNSPKPVIIVFGFTQNNFDFQVEGFPFTFKDKQDFLNIFPSRFVNYLKQSIRNRIQLTEKMLDITFIPILNRRNNQFTRKSLITVQLKPINQKICALLPINGRQTMFQLKNINGRKQIVEYSGRNLYNEAIIRFKKKNTRMIENQEDEEDDSLITFESVYSEGQLQNSLSMHGEFNYFYRIILTTKKRKINLQKFLRRLEEGMNGINKEFEIKKYVNYKYTQAEWGQEREFLQTLYFIVIMHNASQREVNNIIKENNYFICISGSVTNFFKLKFNTEKELNDFKKKDRQFTKNYTKNFHRQTIFRKKHIVQDQIRVYYQFQDLDDSKITAASCFSVMILAQLNVYPEFVHEVPNEGQLLQFPE